MTATPESAGAIGFLTLPALFRDLLARMATGQLVAYRGETVKKVFFKSGFICYATSNLTADRLGDTLLARGVITRDQFDESTRQVLATGRKQGTLLVRTGALAPKDLFHGLIAQVREIVVSLCGWDGGSWRFLAGLPPREEFVSLRLHPAGLIFEGLTLIAADPRWSGVWDPQQLELRPADNAPLTLGQIDTPEIAGRLFSLVGQGRSPEELSRLIGRSAAETAALLYGLALLGFVEDAIKPSYLARAEEFHPDQFFRPEHDKEILPMTTPEARLEAPHEDSRIAREQFTKGIALLNTGDIWSGIEALRWAVNLAPQNPRYHTWLGVALLRTKKRLREAEEHCNAAIALENSNAQYHVHLGQVYRTGRLFDKAKHQFETALRLDPKNPGALKEIRELEPSPESGLLGSFLEK